MSDKGRNRRSHAPLIRWFMKTGGLACALFFSLGSHSNAEQPADYTVKAAYIYSFLKFIDWPETSLAKDGSNLTICSIGGSPLNYAVKALNGRTIQKRALDVREVHASDDLSSCNVLVSGGVRSDQTVSLFKRIDQQPILTVGESPNFARDLGEIGFTIVDDRVKLEINLDRAQNKNIKLSAQLLEVAERVYRGGSQP
ncbi:MAG TPA: YfiR family protein [Pseudomonadales bacterium]|nr:YfiR family protein [Pseudomonadales bacterium]